MFEVDQYVQLIKEEQDKQDKVAEDIAYLREQVEKIMEMIGEIHREIGPVMDGLAKNPMVKMLIGGDK